MRSLDTQHTCLHIEAGEGRAVHSDAVTCCWRLGLLTVFTQIVRFHPETCWGEQGDDLQDQVNKEWRFGKRERKCWGDETKSRKWPGSCHYLWIIILILSRLSHDSPTLSLASSGPGICCWEPMTRLKRVNKPIRSQQRNYLPLI